MIYVIRTKGVTPGYMKIGYSKHAVRERLRKMQTGCPHELELIMLAEGDEKEEKRLHEKLSAFKFRGEWFLYHSEALALLGLKEDTKAIKLTSEDNYMVLAPVLQLRRWT